MIRKTMWGTALAVAVVAVALGGILYAQHGNDPVAVVDLPAQADLFPREVTVYKGAHCTCCGKWANHLREHGFDVHEEVVDDPYAFIAARGVPDHLLSCHVGMVDDYLVVGHVPADLVRRLLTERPGAAGIAVPGMPAGSPGMEFALRKQAYDVIAFGPDHEEYVYDSR